MNLYSHPNPADDRKTRLPYTVAAEFVSRLDEFLEFAHGDADDGPLPRDVIEVVKHCCEAAIDMFPRMVRLSDEGPTSGAEAIRFLSEDVSFAGPEALELILETAEVLAERLADPYMSAPQVPAGAIVPAKWELMYIFGMEFFLELGALTETMLRDCDSEVDSSEVYVLRGCLDAALGMVYVLKATAWPEGQEMPARVLVKMHGLVLGCEEAGHEAVRLVGDVYSAVTSRVIGEH